MSEEAIFLLQNIMAGSLLISVVICTRNRGSLIVPTIETILANTYTNFELLVIDQSTNCTTENAIKCFSSDKRLRYIKTDTKGTGISRYMGLLEAKGKYVLYTDDDCIVSENWIGTITNIFEDNPKTAVIFSSVAPGEFDSNVGMIPNYVYKKDRTIDSLQKYYKSIGMGASMAVRRNAVLAFGGFDQKLGPGSIFRSGEDHDIAVRALVNGWHVQETTKTAVIHLGFRTYDQFRELTERDWFSLGAIYAKTLKSKHFSVIAILLYNLIVRNFLVPLTMVFQVKKPHGFRRAVALSQGFIAGLKVPVDTKNVLYR